MVKALVWSVALYGLETWTLRKEDIKRIQAFEMWMEDGKDQLDSTCVK